MAGAEAAVDVAGGEIASLQVGGDRTDAWGGHGRDPGRGVRNQRSVAELDPIAVQVLLQPAALALVRWPSREIVANLAHGERAELRGRALVQAAPDGLEAVAQQVVCAVARFERDVESFGVEVLELGAQAFAARVAGWVRGRGYGRGAGLPALGQALLDECLDADEAFGDVGDVAGQPGFDCGDAFVDGVDAAAVGLDRGVEQDVVAVGVDHQPTEDDGDQREAEAG